MGMLEHLRGPHDLKRMTAPELAELAQAFSTLSTGRADRPRPRIARWAVSAPLA